MRSVRTSFALMCAKIQFLLRKLGCMRAEEDLEDSIHGDASRTPELPTIQEDENSEPDPEPEIELVVRPKHTSHLPPLDFGNGPLGGTVSFMSREQTVSMIQENRIASIADSTQNSQPPNEAQRRQEQDQGCAKKLIRKPLPVTRSEALPATDSSTQSLSIGNVTITNLPNSAIMHGPDEHGNFITRYERDGTSHSFIVAGGNDNSHAATTTPDAEPNLSAIPTTEPNLGATSMNRSTPMLETINTTAGNRSSVVSLNPININCRDCTNVTGSQRCIQCRDCESCIRCFNCVRCYRCVDCEDCYDCIGLRGVKGVVGALGNRPATES